ncbi:MAG: hypothetical protein WAV60_15835, partial [Anaerolineae bacterium]
MSELFFDSIFEVCCVRIEQGASIAECLASYPELSRYPEQMAELAAALAFVPTLQTLAAPPPPPARLQGEIRHQFLAAAARMTPPPPRVPATSPARPARSAALPRQRP